MTTHGKTDQPWEATGPADGSSTDEPEHAKPLLPSDGFISHQDRLTVPEPAYFRHLKDTDDHDSFEQPDSFESDEHDGRWSSPPSTPDPLAAQKRERSRRFRFWLYIALIVLIYVVFRTMDFMH